MRDESDVGIGGVAVVDFGLEDCRDLGERTRGEPKLYMMRSAVGDIVT